VNERPRPELGKLFKCFVIYAVGGRNSFGKRIKPISRQRELIKSGKATRERNSRAEEFPVSSFVSSINMMSEIIISRLGLT